MRTLLIDFLVYLIPSLVPYLTAVSMPTWRRLLIAATVIGGLLAAGWIRCWLVATSPNFDMGWGTLSIALLLPVLTAGLAAGLCARTLSLILASKALPARYNMTIHILGALIAPGYAAGDDAWNTLENSRPLPEACLNATFTINVANAGFAIPALPFVKVQTGKYAEALFNIRSNLRSFCSLSENGRHPVGARHISFRFGLYLDSPPSFCSGTVPDWASTYCAAYGGAKGRRIDGVEFPLDIDIFAPDEVNLEQFAGSRSTYTNSLQPKPGPDAPLYIQSDISTPDRQPLTFECSKSGGSLRCKASYPWKDGANLSYSFWAADRYEVAEKGKRIDAEARKFLSGFQAMP